jgi:hypothetical protein
MTGIAPTKSARRQKIARLVSTVRFIFSDSGDMRSCTISQRAPCSGSACEQHGEHGVNGTSRCRAEGDQPEREGRGADKRVKIRR